MSSPSKGCRGGGGQAKAGQDQIHEGCMGGCLSYCSSATACPAALARQHTTPTSVPTAPTTRLQRRRRRPGRQGVAEGQQFAEGTGQAEKRREDKRQRCAALNTTPGGHALPLPPSLCLASHLASHQLRCAQHLWGHPGKHGSAGSHTLRRRTHHRHLRQQVPAGGSEINLETSAELGWLAAQSNSGERGAASMWSCCNRATHVR